MCNILVGYFLFSFLMKIIWCKNYVPDVDLEETYPHWNKNIVNYPDLPPHHNRPIINGYTKKFQLQIEQNCSCGQRKPSSIEERIIGGQNTERHEYPWQVALVQKHTRVVMCGGTLINSHYVLTASHCVLDFSEIPISLIYKKFYDFQILLHAHMLNSKKEIEDIQNGHIPDPSMIASADLVEGSVRKNPKNIIFHHGFIYELQQYNTVWGWGDDDIALIRLDEPIEMGIINTACLPDSDKYEEYKDKTGLIIGWGLTQSYDYDFNSRAHSLQKLNVPIRQNNLCQNSNIVFDHFICIGEGSIEKDAAQGDSGGPLLLELNDKRYEQLGVTSYGVSQEEISYTAYTRITEYLPWIYHHIGKDEQLADIKWCKP